MACLAVSAIVREKADILHKLLNRNFNFRAKCRLMSWSDGITKLWGQ
jgi:hypothetical protein